MNIELTRLTKSYGGFVAVQDVSLQVPISGLTGIIGPNGAGKTTLFSLISGVQQPTTGEIRVNGEDITGTRPYQRARKGIGRTFQVPRPFSHLTVRENLHVAALDQPGDSMLAFLFRRTAVTRKETEVADKASAIMDLLKLRVIENSLANSLSGGQKKLLELGRAMMLNPSVMLLDEPFAGVNPVLIEQISESIQTLHQKGIGFVIIEHNLGALSRLVHRMIVMDRGKILADGVPDTVMADEAVRVAYMGGVV